MLDLRVSARFEVVSEPAVQLYQVLHRYEMGTLKASEPETTRLEPMYYTPMTEAIQWMCFDLLFWDLRHGDRSGITADEKRIFNSVYEGDTFITNERGVEAFRNYITGERMSADLPGFMSLILGGNVLTGTETVYKGVPSLQASILTGAAPVGSLARWQYQHATICTLTKLANGSYQVNPFPQRGGRAGGAPVLVPVLCNKPVYIPLSKLRKLPSGSAVPNPYNPPWVTYDYLVPIDEDRVPL